VLKRQHDEEMNATKGQSGVIRRSAGGGDARREGELSRKDNPRFKALQQRD
jgi:hypothetical protein